MINKFITRKTIKDKRMCMPKEAVNRLSEVITRELLTTEAYRCADTICLYVSTKNEVDTTHIITSALYAGKKVAAPRVRGKEMDFVLFSSLDELAPGSFGVMEPQGDNIITPEDALLIMPGVAFDLECNRIGYGGGYYDKYLAEHKALYSIALAYEIQMVDKLEPEGFDVKPDMIITEKRVITR